MITNADSSYVITNGTGSWTGIETCRCHVIVHGTHALLYIWYTYVEAYFMDRVEYISKYNAFPFPDCRYWAIIYF